MKSFKKLVFYTLISIFGLVIFNTITVLADDTLYNNKKVLFISSHKHSCEYFNQKLLGLEKTLGPEIQIQVEYMDSDIFQNIEDEENFYNLLKYKLNNYVDYEGIILSDEKALQFAIKYKEELFNNKKLYFMGVSDIQLINKAEEINGIIECQDIAENVELIIKLHPGIKRIFFIHDKSVNINENLFLKLTEKYEGIDFQKFVIDQSNYSEILGICEKLTKQDIILASVPHKNGNSYTVEADDLISSIYKVTKAPIYSTYSFGIKNGSIGGKVVNGYRQGVEIAELILKNIDTTSVPNQVISQQRSTNTYIFDYNMLKRHKINKDLLPKDSIILNKPMDFWQLYMTYFSIINMLIIVLGLIFIFLITYTINSRRSEKEMLKAKKIAEEANVTKGNFITNISHELRTPISLILSANQLLKTKLDNSDMVSREEYFRDIDIINQNCFRLMRIVNNVIDIAKVDSGDNNVNLRNINIVEYVETITMSVIPYGKLKNLSIVFDTTDEEIITAIDVEKFEKVILNILSNSIKFSRETGYIYIYVSRSEKDVIISIEDNGIGIKKEYLEKILEKFVQVDKSINRKSEGSGIGLAIVDSFVRMHNGSVLIDSIHKVGTTVNIKIPIMLVEEEDELISYKQCDDNSNVISTRVEFSDIYF